MTATTITADEGIELVRINPIYSINLKEDYHIKIIFERGTVDCVANYVEIIENPANLVLEFYWAEDNPARVTTLSFAEVQAINFSRPQLNTLQITIQQTKIENPD